MRIPDKTLIIASLLTSSIGMIGLLIIAASTNTSIPMSEAMIAPEDTVVTINATITSVTHYQNITFLALQHNCTLSAIIFEDKDVRPATAMITGTMTHYQGRKELVVTKIKQ